MVSSVTNHMTLLVSRLGAFKDVLVDLEAQLNGDLVEEGGPVDLPNVGLFLVGHVVGA